MGLDIDREKFTPEDYDRFRGRLDGCLEVLELLLERTGFGDGPLCLGAELEVALVDALARPLPMNEEVLQETLDDRMTVELDRFNLESNLRHTSFEERRPFTHLRAEIDSACAELARAAGVHDGRVAMIGILPTLTEDDLSSDVMTDVARYRALSRSLRERREGPFRLDIHGEDRLELSAEDVTFEGAATSFQLHLRVPPGDFPDVFDAAQLATGPVLAAAGNSPTFLGHRLWEETRVALFKQAVDDRGELDRLVHRPPRVSLGADWIREGVIELFRRSARNYPVLLPIVDGEDPREALEAGRIPSLKEIRLHQGTVWHWNRPVYDPAEGGHLRIELRALPSGPTTADILANAAFLVGLSLGIAPYMKEVREQFEFDAAHRNFYRAAQSGLGAALAWPEMLGGDVSAGALPGLYPRLGELAKQGLRSAGVDAADSDPHIDLLLERVERGQTGAVWQRKRLSSLSSGHPEMSSLTAMFEEYLARSEEGEPVHTWATP